ncbi:MAG: hypothetical protein ACLPKE_36245 [Streptosporangiaceae bacterium]
MATENAGHRERDLNEDPLVAALVPDPAQLPVNAAVLRGFIGKSLDEGSWRLYLDAELTEYVEIPKAEILYARELPDGGGTAVWVPGTLRLDRVRVAATQIQAEFLSGAIAAAGLRAAVQAQGPGIEFIRIKPTFGADCFPSELLATCGGPSTFGEPCRQTIISCFSPCLPGAT